MIVPLNNPWELRAFGVTQLAPPPLLPSVRARLLATRCARQPLYYGRLDTPTEGELNMKRLLGLLLVMGMGMGMGMVGCGGGDDTAPANGWFECGGSK